MDADWGGDGPARRPGPLVSAVVGRAGACLGACGLWPVAQRTPCSRGESPPAAGGGPPARLWSAWPLWARWTNRPDGWRACAGSLGGFRFSSLPTSPPPPSPLSFGACGLFNVGDGWSPTGCPAVWPCACLRSRYLHGTHPPASPRSEWARTHYRELKLLNPGMPIAMRPADGASPYIAARFDNGVYRSTSTAGMDTNGRSWLGGGRRGGGGCGCGAWRRRGGVAPVVLRGSAQGGAAKRVSELARRTVGGGWWIRGHARPVPPLRFWCCRVFD